MHGAEERRVELQERFAPVQTTSDFREGPSARPQARARKLIGGLEFAAAGPSVPAKSVRRNGRRRCAISSRPTRDCSPQRRRKTAGLPVFAPSPAACRKISFTAYMDADYDVLAAFRT